MSVIAGVGLYAWPAPRGEGWRGSWPVAGWGQVARRLAQRRSPARSPAMPSQVRGVLSWRVGPLLRIEVMCAIVCQMLAVSTRPCFAQAADSR
jgi:hypothetical protein